jgi:predicted nucleotidyltransferase
MTEQQLLNLFKKENKSRLKTRVKKIILFGSRARGDNAPDSDYDLILVINKLSPATKKSINEIEGEFLFNYNAVFSSHRSAARFRWFLCL